MNLGVEYLGKRFENPFVLASGPPTANAEMIARGFEAGWAGAVVKTLIREPVRNLKNRFASNRLGADIYAFENLELLSEQNPETWYRGIGKLKAEFPHKILIGSIMGDARERSQWAELALGCQDAGADMIELNFSCPHGYPEKGEGMAIGQNAGYAEKITRWLKEEKRISCPVIPKLTAAVSDISFIGEAVRRAGAAGISAINTFPSLMGFDLKTLKPKASIRGKTSSGGYSGTGLKPIALRCVSDLVKRPGLPVMACGGVSSGNDAAEFMLLGAPVVQVCTAVMLHGYGMLDRLRRELEDFMRTHGFNSIGEFCGIGNRCVEPFSGLDPDWDVHAAIDPRRCSGCGDCYVSCRDAAYQAIEMKGGAAAVIEGRCEGCGLCIQVCRNDAVRMVAS